MKQDSTCNLCSSQKDLIGQSHIIPDFMYEGLFDESERTALVKNDDPTARKYFQTGFYDKYVMCANCDNDVIGSYERYAAGILYGEATPTDLKIQYFETTSENIQQLKIQGINYDRFKIFLLSVLWRASKSKNPFFNQVKLTTVEEDIIKKMIYSGEIFPDNKYRIAIFSIVSNWGEPIRIMVTPGILNLPKGRVAKFIMGGFLFFIEIDLNTGFELFNIASFSRSEIVIPILEGIYARDFLTMFNIHHRIVNQILNPSFSIFNDEYLKQKATSIIK